MEITADLVKHVATSARLELSETEIEQFKQDFQEILNNFSVLDDADVANVSPAFHPVVLKDKTRDDVADKTLSHEEALQNVTDSSDGYIRGPKIV